MGRHAVDKNDMMFLALRNSIESHMAIVTTAMDPPLEYKVSMAYAGSEFLNQAEPGVTITIDINGGARLESD